MSQKNSDNESYSANTFRTIPKKMHNKIDAISKEIKTWKTFTGILILVIFGLLFTIIKIPSHITIYSTPELRAGGEFEVDYVSPFSIYSFPLYVFQQIYTVDNLSSDVESNIKRFSNYLTPEFKRDLLNRFALDNSVIKDGVSQSVKEISETSKEEKIIQLTPDKWVVFLDLKITDRLNGEIIKSAFIRFPIIVERADYDESRNPAALVLSGFYREPQRIK